MDSLFQDYKEKVQAQQSSNQVLSDIDDYVNELDVEQEELHWGEENDQSDSFLGAEEDTDYLDEDNVRLFGKHM